MHMQLKCAVLSQGPQQTTIRFATSVEISPGYRWYKHFDAAVPSGSVEMIPVRSRPTFRVSVDPIRQLGSYSVVELPNGGIFRVPNFALTDP